MKIRMLAVTILPLMLLTTACSREGVSDSAQLPAVIENFGFNLADFDPSTGFAGDLKISGVVPPVLPDNDPNKASMDSANRYLIDVYGYEQMQGLAPQISFFLPLGTKVISMVTGTVCEVSKLYSGDYSVRVAPEGVDCKPEGKGGAVILFETEHVNNPTVGYGDKVKAGQVIAEVSDYRYDWKEKGLGVVEIGIAFNKPGSSAPWHACPMRFLEPEKKAALVKSLTSAYAAWESELGDTTLYDETLEFPGCLSTEDITDNNNSETGESN